jgi:hypothetical protein
MWGPLPNLISREGETVEKTYLFQSSNPKFWRTLRACLVRFKLLSQTDLGAAGVDRKIGGVCPSQAHEPTNHANVHLYNTRSKREFGKEGFARYRWSSE